MCESWINWLPGHLDCTGARGLDSYVGRVLKQDWWERKMEGRKTLYLSAKTLTLPEASLEQTFLASLHRSTLFTFFFVVVIVGFKEGGS